MANINKIKLSGTSYDIQDSNAARSVTLTQAEYDVLQTKDPNVFYIISDSSISYMTSADTESAITQAVSGKADTTAVTSVNNSLTAHTANTTVHVTAQDKTNWNNKSDFSGNYNDLTNKPTIPTVPTSNTAFTNDAGYITSSALDGYATTGDVQTATNDMATKTWVGQQGYLTEHQSLSNYYKKSETSGATQISTALASKANTATTYTKTQVDTALGGKQATLVSGTNIKTINNESILGSGNIDIQGSGGKAMAAGTNISITTGETADTINCTLNAKNGTGNHSFIGNGIFGGVMNSATGDSATAFGLSNNANGRASFVVGGGNYGNGEYSFVGGNSSEARGYNSFAFGYGAKTIGQYSIAFGSYFPLANNTAEVAIGKANVSHTGSTDADKTLFSVGNGTNSSNRHNAFEIRQNGDIYLTKDGQDVKLQDQLGGGGNSVVELTQAEYDVLVSSGTVDPDTFYVITDAQEIDTSNYYTSAQTQSAITQAVSGKQDTLISGTNIKTINNQSLLGSGNIDIQGGGGKAIEAGIGISITTGETADTVSFNLPISAGTGTNALVIASDTYKISDKAKGSYSVSLNGGNLHPNYAKGSNSLAEGMDTKTYGNACHSEGYGTKAGVENNINIQYAHAEGDHTEAKGTASHAEGSYTIANNWVEHASGRYNNSVSASTTFGDSGNTLFSVGNGTASNARHNAFEIRQNGDIYLSLNGQDVKLQDQLGGGGASYSAGTGIDITNNVISVSGVVETSAITTAITSSSTDAQVPSAKAVNDKLGGLSLVKLTQSEYDNLSTKDNSTLYVIVN